MLNGTALESADEALAENNIASSFVIDVSSLIEFKPSSP
jgi:hypothetical protein